MDKEKKPTITPGYNGGLTTKQMLFCHEMMSGKTDIDAYVVAYRGGDPSGVKKSTLTRKANEYKNGKGVKEYLKELKEKASKNSEITTKGLLEELEGLRLEALKKGVLNVAYQAIMGKAKLTGKDKQIIELDDKRKSPIINLTIKGNKK